MGYKAFASMNIAIIGNEKTTAVLAQGLALAGHDIFIGIKEDEQIILEFLAEEFPNVFVTTIEEAARHADLIIMATKPEDVREASYLLDDVRQKVILDSTFMSYKETPAYLNTLTAIKAITGSQYVVKCFNAAGFEPLPVVLRDEQAVNMFLAGDNRKAKELARLIARDLGYADCHDFGGSDSVVLLDEMAVCYYQMKTGAPAGNSPVKITKP